MPLFADNTRASLSRIEFEHANAGHGAVEIAEGDVLIGCYAALAFGCLKEP